MTSRDDFVETLKAKLDEWNAEIARLEAEAGKTRAELRARYAEELAEMRRLRDEAEARLGELLNTSQEGWERRRHEMEQAWADIAEGFRRAWSRFS